MGSHLMPCAVTVIRPGCGDRPRRRMVRRAASTRGLDFGSATSTQPRKRASMRRCREGFARTSSATEGPDPAMGSPSCFSSMYPRLDISPGEGRYGCSVPQRDMALWFETVASLVWNERDAAWIMALGNCECGNRGTIVFHLAIERGHGVDGRITTSSR